MHQRVTHTGRWQVKPIVRSNYLSRRHPVDFDEVLKTAAQHFRFRPVWPAAKQCAAVARKHSPIRPLQTISIRLTQGDVEPAIGTKDQPMQAAVVLMAELTENYRALIGASVAIRVAERHDIGRISDIKPAVVPRQPHGKDQSFCKNVSHLEPSVAIL